MKQALKLKYNNVNDINYNYNWRNWSRVPVSPPGDRRQSFCWWSHRSKTRYFWIDGDIFL